MNTYVKENEAIMKELMEKHHAENGKVSFAKDGIISPETWFSLDKNDEKILVLLKEAYDSALLRIWDETKWLCHERCTEFCDHKGDCNTCHVTGNTFNPVAEWVYGIIGSKCGSPLPYDNWIGISSKDMNEYNEKRDSLLKRIAIVNIKKANGEKSSSYKDLLEYAMNDKDLLHKQIFEAIKPTVIICGNTYDLLRAIAPELPKLENSTDGHYTLNGIKIIAAYHPMAPVKGGNQKKYENVVNAYVKG